MQHADVLELTYSCLENPLQASKYFWGEARYNDELKVNKEWRRRAEGKKGEKR